MFVEHPSQKKGMQKPGKSAGAPHKSEKNTIAGYSKLEDGHGGKSMEHCSRLLGGKALEPKVMSHYFGEPGHKGK